MLYDHKEKGWFIPRVDSEEQARRLKQGVLDFNRGNFGTELAETGLERIAWRHDGNKFSAVVGEVLDFYGQKEHVWVILAHPSRGLRYVVTTNRGALGDGPILVGAHDLLGV